MWRKLKKTKVSSITFFAGFFFVVSVVSSSYRAFTSYMQCSLILIEFTSSHAYASSARCNSETLCSSATECCGPMGSKLFLRVSRCGACIQTFQIHFFLSLRIYNIKYIVGILLYACAGCAEDISFKSHDSKFLCWKKNYLGTLWDMHTQMNTYIYLFIT